MSTTNSVDAVRSAVAVIRARAGEAAYPAGVRTTLGAVLAHLAGTLGDGTHGDLLAAMRHMGGLGCPITSATYWIAWAAINAHSERDHAESVETALRDAATELARVTSGEIARAVDESSASRST